MEAQNTGAGTAGMEAQNTGAGTAGMGGQNACAGSESEISAGSEKRSRYKSAAVKSEVYHRDDGYCTYVDAVSGRACRSRYGLDYDHFKIPFAKGGESTPDNLTLRCKQHNAFGAIKEFGLDKMEKYWSGPSESATSAQV